MILPEILMKLDDVVKSFETKNSTELVIDHISMEIK